MGRYYSKSIFGGLVKLGRSVLYLFGRLVKYSAVQFSVYSTVWIRPTVQVHNDNIPCLIWQQCVGLRCCRHESCCIFLFILKTQKKFVKKISYQILSDMVVQAQWKKLTSSRQGIFPLKSFIFRSDTCEVKFYWNSSTCAKCQNVKFWSDKTDDNDCLLFSLHYLLHSSFDWFSWIDFWVAW